MKWMKRLWYQKYILVKKKRLKIYNNWFQSKEYIRDDQLNINMRGMVLISKYVSIQLLKQDICIITNKTKMNFTPTRIKTFCQEGNYTKKNK